MGFTEITKGPCRHNRIAQFCSGQIPSSLRGVEIPGEICSELIAGPTVKGLGRRLHLIYFPMRCLCRNLTIFLYILITEHRKHIFKSAVHVHYSASTKINLQHFTCVSNSNYSEINPNSNNPSGNTFLC